MQPIRTASGVRAAGAVLLGVLGVSLVSSSPSWAATKRAAKRAAAPQHKTQRKTRKTRKTSQRTPASRMAASQRNATLMRRFYDEVFNSGDMAAADKFIAANFVDYTPFPGQPGTREGLKNGYPQMRAAFPDLHFTVNDVIVQGDKIVARWTAQGTHQGDFMGIAPTGKAVQMHGVDIVQIAGGKAVAHWGYGDESIWMQQIAPAPTAPPTATPVSPVAP